MKISCLLIPFCFLVSLQTAFAQTQSPYTFKKPSANGTGKVYMGREIAHVMSFEGVDWLERNSRTQEENTTLALASLPLKSNSIVADIGAGSGFLWDDKGHIVTNYHVIASATKTNNPVIKVKLQGMEAQTATIVGYEPEKDLAVLKIFRRKWSAVSWTE